MSKSRYALGDFQNPERVRSAIEKKDREGLSLIKGALGAIAEGSKVDQRDESTAASAKRYGRMLAGAKDQGELGEKDYPKIAELIQGFITGPKRTFRTTPREATSMTPEMISETLLEIADYLDKSSNPSRSKVASTLSDVIFKVALAGQKPIVLTFDAGPAAANNLVDCILELGVSAETTLAQSLKDEALKMSGEIESEKDRSPFELFITEAKKPEAVESISTQHDIDLIPILRKILSDANVIEVTGEDATINITIKPDGNAYWSGVDKPVKFDKLEEWFGVGSAEFENEKERAIEKLKTHSLRAKA